MKVLIQTTSSSKFDVPVEPYSTVSELKAMIQKLDKTQFEEINLKYESEYLEDHLPLAAYNIKDGAVINMTVMTTNTDKFHSQSGRFAYRSMQTKRDLKANMESLKSQLSAAITESVQYHQLSVSSLGEQINCIEMSDEEGVALLGTDQGHIIHYNYVDKKVVKTETQTEQHGVSKVAVASLTGTLAIGAPTGVYIYQQGEGMKITTTLKPVTIIKITRDGESVYYKRGERAVEKYSVSKSKKELTFNFDGPIMSIVLSYDEKRIVLGGKDTPITIFSTEDASILYNIPDSKYGTATFLKMTSDDRQLIAAYKERTIKVYNLENDSVHVFRHSHSSDITAIVLTPNNKILFSGSSDGCLTIYDLEKLIVLYYFNHFQKGGIHTLRVTENGKMLLSAGEGEKGEKGDNGEKGGLVLYELEQIEENISVNTTYGAINCLTNHPLGEHFIAGCHDGTIRIFNHTAEEAERSIADIFAGEVFAITCSSTGKNEEFIAASFEDLSIRVFSYLTGKVVAQYEKAHDDKIIALAFSKDFQMIISSSHDNSLKVWQAQHQEPGPTHIYRDKVSFGPMCLCNDGKHLVVASSGKNLTILEFSQIHSINTKDIEIKSTHLFADVHDGNITSIACSSNNKYIVSVGEDCLVKVFDLKRRTFVHSFPNYHATTLKSVIITKKDQYIISVDEEGVINLFNLTTRKHVHTDVVPNSGKILASIGTPDSSKIITGCASGKVNILVNQFAPTPVNVSCGSLSADSTLGFCLLKDFIMDTSSSRKRGEIITKYANLYVHPFEWNFLHIIAIFCPEIELVDICIKEKISFVIDHNGYTPLHYLLHFHKHNLTVINYMLGKFGELIQDERDLPRVIEALSNQVQEIIHYGKFQAANFLEYAVMEPQRFGKNSLTSFGSLGKAKSKYMIAESPVFSPELQKELLGEKGDQMLSVKIIGFKFDYGPSSKDMLRLMLFLNDVNNQEIYKTRPVSQIIDYLWAENKTFFYLPTVIFSAVMVAVSVYCGLPVGQRPFWLEAVILVSGALSLLYEFWLLVLESSLYFKDLWNGIDIAVDALLIAVPIVAWTEGRECDNSQRMLTGLLFLGYSRWFSYFRVIDQTRKLAKMIAEVLKDMASFLMVLIFLTIGFAFIFLQMRPTSTFGNELFKTYALIYTNYNEEPEGSEIPYFVIFTVFVSVTLLNLLISIMNETYDRVQQIRYYYENKTKISLIIESITAKRFLLRITSNIRKSLLWRRITLCPTRFGSALARLHPERGMRILERQFATRSGFLYFAEQIEKNEYLQVMESRINQNNAKNNLKLKAMKEEKQNGMDPVFLKSLLREVLDENNEKWEAEKQQREQLTTLINNMDEKFTTMISDALKEKASLVSAMVNAHHNASVGSRKDSEDRDYPYSEEWKYKMKLSKVLH